MEERETTRINKAIAESGYCSRRKADALIEAGKVTINGKVAVLGDRVVAEDKITVNGELITENENLVYIALNKPVGITCTTDRRVAGNVVDFINHKERIFHVGRLDKPSEGLLLMTNDGDIVNKILRAGNRHEKEYIVTVDKPITDEFIQKMASGVPVLDRMTKKCEVSRISKYVFRIVLVQGLNRQIRRMCEYLGYRVTRLKRVRIMNIKLGDLEVGQWRDLRRDELKELNQAVSTSLNTPQSQRDTGKSGRRRR